MGKLYNEDSIESLSPLEFTRLRPQVYAGDTTYSTQLLVEILSNAIDEYRLGNGSRIEITIDKDKVYCRDFGQGFLPNSIREDGKTILEAAFSVLNTSGKYRDDGTYDGVSLGSFGIGSKITTYLSHWLTVVTYRDGQYEHLTFNEGVFEKRESGPQGNNKTGTEVCWQPSEEFFTHTEVEISKVQDLIKTLVCLCKGLTIILNNNGKITEYKSEFGLLDLVTDLVKDKELIKNRFVLNEKKDKDQIDFVLTYTSNYSATIVPYVNCGLTEKGPHITQIKTVLTREFNKFFREKKWLKEKDDNLSGDDIQEGLFIVFNLTAPNVAYNAQVKSTVTKIEMSNFTQALTNALQKWFITNEKEVKVIADKAINAKKARDAAKKAREAVRKPKEKGLKAKMQISNKFIDCTNKNPAERSLLLVEGLSAGSAAVEARDAKRDAIYMLRGKPIAPLKTAVDKLLANQEINDIVRVIGAGFGDGFDVTKMNFDKIVLTADQDADGKAICLILTTFFFTYMRPLIDAGKLYVAETPLYIVRTGKEELYFYTEKEMSDYRTKTSGKYDVLRAKGIGELNARDLHKVCFENERYKRITVSDAVKAKELLEILQGKAVEPRKKFIYENANELGFHFD